MDHVTSADGTEIAFERRGDGPALLLVHGTGGDRHVWDRVLPDLAEEFTVYAIDRRGRGASGDAEEYAIEREFEDIVAVAEAADGPVNLLAHSYGAVCAIGAAPRLSDLDHLLLYEPALSRGDVESGPPAEVEQMDEHVERGEHERVLEVFYEDIAGDPERLEKLRARSDFDRRLDTASTFPREIRGRLAFRPTPETYPEVDEPTLLLVGTETSEALAAAVEYATDLFPNETLVELEGEGHGAMNTAPDRFVSEVEAFIRETEEQSTGETPTDETPSGETPTTE